MAYSFSNDQLNKAKKNYYGRLYVTKVNPNFILKLTNKLLIFKYYFKYLLINIKRKIFRFLDIQSKPKSHRKAITFSLNLNKKLY